MIRSALVAWRSAGTALSLGLAVSAGLLLGGCGGDNLFGDSEDHIDRPLVRQFSPTISPIDFNTLQQNPTFTDGQLTVSTSPQYPGEVVVFFQQLVRSGSGEFQDGTIIDPASIFLGGDPVLGLDPSALQFSQSIPGTGNVLVPLAKVIVDQDRIRLLPDALWNLDANGNPVVDAGGALPNGQYSVGVFKNVKNIKGRELLEGPVFHSFTVGTADTIAPFVVTTSPLDLQEDVGAGVPPTPPSETVADVRTNIFGPTSPPITIRFNEGIAANTVTTSNVTVSDAGAFVPGGGAPPQIAPAPGYPRLKSVEDGTTLPSNGFEILWVADPQFGSFPFGTTVQVTVVGSYNDLASFLAGPPVDNASPIRDLSGNAMEISKIFTFRTLAPPDLPANPFPEYAIYWSATERVGVLDTINQQTLADQFMGAFPGNQRIPQNVLPPFTDAITTSQHVPGLDPLEISVDSRTNGATCHTFLYVMSPSSGEIVIVNTRSSLPVAIIKTPSPGGISNQTGGGQAANVLCVTNSSANTLTIFDVNQIRTGTTFLVGTVFVQKVTTTGNTPRAVAITLSLTGDWERDPFQGGPPIPMIMYVDYTDGVVNTKTIHSDKPVYTKQLGAASSPNDVAFTPCYIPCFGCPVIMYAAITIGGNAVLEGKVAFYVAGPGCGTGNTIPIRPDAVIDDIGGLDAPAGIDETFSIAAQAAGVENFFIVAESGSQMNAATSIGPIVGNINTPRSPEIRARYRNIGANPVALAHRPAWTFPLIGVAGSLTCYFPPPPPGCVYKGTEQCLVAASLDQTLGVCQDIYVCCRGGGIVQVIDLTTGLRQLDSPIAIPGVRFLASLSSQ